MNSSLTATVRLSSTTSFSVRRQGCQACWPGVSVRVNLARRHNTIPAGRPPFCQLVILDQTAIIPWLFSLIIPSVIVSWLTLQSSSPGDRGTLAAYQTTISQVYRRKVVTSRQSIVLVPIPGRDDSVKVPVQSPRPARGHPPNNNSPKPFVARISPAVTIVTGAAVLPPSPPAVPLSDLLGPKRALPFPLVLTAPMSPSPPPASPPAIPIQSTFSTQQGHYREVYRANGARFDRIAPELSIYMDRDGWLAMAEQYGLRVGFNISPIGCPNGEVYAVTMLQAMASELTQCSKYQANYIIRPPAGLGARWEAAEDLASQYFGARHLHSWALYPHEVWDAVKGLIWEKLGLTLKGHENLDIWYVVASDKRIDVIVSTAH